MAEAKEDKSFLIELNNWRWEDLKAWQAASAEQDIEKLSPLAMKVVEEWPFDADVKNPDALKNLGVVDIFTTFNAIGKALTKTFSQGN